MSHLKYVIKRELGELYPKGMDDTSSEIQEL